MSIHAQLKILGKSTEDIGKIAIRTHQACLRVIDKQGPLHNPADRDHCLQYVLAVPLLFGRLGAAELRRRRSGRSARRCPAREDGMRRGAPIHPRLP